MCTRISSHLAIAAVSAAVFVDSGPRRSHRVVRQGRLCWLRGVQAASRVWVWNAGVEVN